MHTAPRGRGPPGLLHVVDAVPLPGGLRVGLPGPVPPVLHVTGLLS